VEQKAPEPVPAQTDDRGTSTARETTAAEQPEVLPSEWKSAGATMEEDATRGIV